MKKMHCNVVSINNTYKYDNTNDSNTNMNNDNDINNKINIKIIDIN